MCTKWLGLFRDEEREYTFEDIIRGKGDIEHPEYAHIKIEFRDGKSLLVHDRKGMSMLKQVCQGLNVWKQ